MADVTIYWSDTYEITKTLNYDLAYLHVWGMHDFGTTNDYVFKSLHSMT